MNNTEAIKELDSMWSECVDNIAVDATVKADWAEAMKKACEALRRKDDRSMSVANGIKALALINVRDIFQFMITAKDDDIIERYGSEERAVDVAEKYMEIAMKASALESLIKGWSMSYTMPIKGSDDRREYTAYFYEREEKE